MPERGAGRCLGPERNGVSSGKGVRGDPAAQEAREISSRRQGQHGQGGGGAGK